MEATTEAPQTETTTDTVPTVADFIDEQGHLPGYTETNELIRRLVRSLYDEEPAYRFEDVKLTWMPVRECMIKGTRLEAAKEQVRIDPEIGPRFWQSRDALVPAVAFRLVEETGHSEWWTDTLHPRIVAAGPAAVHEHVAAWIYHSITGQFENLGTLLRKLQALRDVEQLDWTWPQGLDVEPGDTWDADPNDYLPTLEDEGKAAKAGELYGE